MQVGGSLLNDRAEGEVRYYYHDVHRRVRSVLPDGPERVSWPYGGYYLRGKDSSGGWIGSAVDLVRLVSALDGGRPPSPLLPETVELMLSRHDPPLRNTTHGIMPWDGRSDPSETASGGRMAEACRVPLPRSGEHTMG